MSKTFPQHLWKKLWKSPFSTLQVPDNFRLVALCTLTRQFSQALLIQSFDCVLHVPHRVRRKTFSFCCCFALIASVPSCVRQPRAHSDVDRTAPQFAVTGQVSTTAPPLININIASRNELEKLPGVGPSLASRIIEHRERHGPFRRAEHLMMVRGFSDRRFRELRAHIDVQ